MYKILNIIEDSDKVKDTVKTILTNYGIKIENIIIEKPETMSSFIEKGLTVKIISPQFRQMALLTKIGLLSKLSTEINPRLRAKGYTPEEFYSILEPIDKLNDLTERKTVII